MAGSTTMSHLIDIKKLTKEEIYHLFAMADEIKNNSHKQNNKILRNKTVANLFFENSTRTLVSFELAAKRLGAHVVNVNIAKSSTQKGETLRDTILTLQAMGIDAFVVRHPDNGICNKIKEWLQPNTVLINAGDGNNQHPTQALLDTYTIVQHKANINEIKLAIIGDIKHSRVANSLIECLHILGNNNIHLFAPKQLLPAQSNRAIICNSMQETINQADVICMLRIQQERMTKHNIPDLDDYHKNYGLNSDNLKFAKTDCLVMHPGPINREVEITSEVADGKQSVILEQVENGVLIRQAILSSLMLKA